jgi:hypothetical protein
MLDIPIDVPVQPDAGRLDPLLKTLIGAKYAGISITPRRAVLHVNDLLTRDELTRATAAVTTESYGLTLAVNKPQITADGGDNATIICNNPIIAADTSLAYTVTFSGIIDGIPYTDGDYASGTAPVENGAVTLTLAVEFAGSYRILLRRTAVGALEFGTATITAI